MFACSSACACVPMFISHYVCLCVYVLVHMCMFMSVQPVLAHVGMFMSERLVHMRVYVCICAEYVGHVLVCM